MPTSLYYRIKRIRLIEEAIAARYAEQEMRCPTHFSIGQEANAVVVCDQLRDTDLAVSTHRAHAHYLAKGGSLPALIAELYGRESGCSSGKGGSMHLVDQSVGFMGSTAIVGGTIPLAAGLALSLQHSGGDDIACLFVGDGATEEGVFYETVNFAAVRRLPLFICCENNLYSVYSPLRVRQPEGRRIVDLVAAMGIPGRACQGDDPVELQQTCSDLIGQVRQGGGPRFIEIATYRWREHCGPNYDNQLGYRTETEFQMWRDRDPLNLFEQQLLANGELNITQCRSIEEEIRTEIEDAFAFAIASPYPPPEAMSSDIYRPAAEREGFPWAAL